jgi:ferredoxin
MVVNIPKPAKELIELLDEYKSLFVVACGGCPVGCESGGIDRVKELEKLLAELGKKVTGRAIIDFLCNKALVGSKLISYLGPLKKTDGILVVSCGIGVQATGNMIDLPAIPANDTLSSQGMQGLWPSSERCAGCGTCYLSLTGGICPITTCSKSLLNGMCGGQHDGKCEVEENRDCGWNLIYERLKELGKLDNLKKIPMLRDYRKLDVSDKDRMTTRWALEKREIYSEVVWKQATEKEEA